MFLVLRWCPAPRNNWQGRDDVTASYFWNACLGPSCLRGGPTRANASLATPPSWVPDGGSGSEWSTTPMCGAQCDDVALSPALYTGSFLMRWVFELQSSCSRPACQQLPYPDCHTHRMSAVLCAFGIRRQGGSSSFSGQSWLLPLLLLQSTTLCLRVHSSPWRLAKIGGSRLSEKSLFIEAGFGNPWNQ